MASQKEKQPNPTPLPDPVCFFLHSLRVSAGGSWQGTLVVSQGSHGQHREHRPPSLQGHGLGAAVPPLQWVRGAVLQGTLIQASMRKNVSTFMDHDTH